MADTRWLPEFIEQVPDLGYTDDGGTKLLLDVFRQRGMTVAMRQPAVIWIHGGGWMSGDKARGVERLFGLVQRGFVGASINYRLSDEAIFPAQIHDCKCAIRFLRAHATQLNIDPERIGVWGASAGGHLASLLAVTRGVRELEGERGWADQSSAVQAACSWFGPTDLNLSDQYEAGITPHYPTMTADSPEGRLVGGKVADRQDLVLMANPIAHIHPEAPPILLMHGARDDAVPLVASLKFHEAIVRCGGCSQLHVIKHGHHNAYLWGDHHLQIVEEFFEWHLRRQDRTG